MPDITAVSRTDDTGNSTVLTGAEGDTGTFVGSIDGGTFVNIPNPKRRFGRTREYRPVDFPPRIDTSNNLVNPDARLTSGSYIRDVDRYQIDTFDGQTAATRWNSDHEHAFFVTQITLPNSEGGTTDGLLVLGGTFFPAERTSGGLIERGSAGGDVVLSGTEGEDRTVLEGFEGNREEGDVPSSGGSTFADDETSNDAGPVTSGFFERNSNPQSNEVETDPRDAELLLGEEGDGSVADRSENSSGGVIEVAPGGPTFPYGRRNSVTADTDDSPPPVVDFGQSIFGDIPISGRIISLVLSQIDDLDRGS